MVSVNKYIINDNEIFIGTKLRKLCEEVGVVRESLGFGEVKDVIYTSKLEFSWIIAEFFYELICEYLRELREKK